MDVDAMVLQHHGISSHNNDQHQMLVIVVAADAMVLMPSYYTWKSLQLPRVKWRKQMQLQSHLSWYLLQALSLIYYYPLFRVRSWNNGVCCMSFYILINISIQPHRRLNMERNKTALVMTHSYRYKKIKCDIWSSPHFLGILNNKLIKNEK